MTEMHKWLRELCLLVGALILMKLGLPWQYIAAAVYAYIGFHIYKAKPVKTPLGSASDFYQAMAAAAWPLVVLMAMASGTLRIGKGDDQ